MKHERLDHEIYKLGRVPSPFHLCRAYAFPNSVAMILPLAKNGGAAVMLVSYLPKLTVIPAAWFDRLGNLLRIPTRGLQASSRTDLPFPYEIEATMPLRTAADPRNLGRAWADEHLDQPPKQHR